MCKVHNKYHRTAPSDAVYIGRGSPYGNPFIIGKDDNREDVCRKFREQILPTLDLEPLKGKDLVCFCKPAQCHGDDLLQAANMSDHQIKTIKRGSIFKKKSGIFS